MSSVPRTVASLEFATILFILKGDRCLRISSAPTRPRFPCSRTDILPTTRRLLVWWEGLSVSQSEEDFHAILQANILLLLLFHEVCQ